METLGGDTDPKGLVDAISPSSSRVLRLVDEDVTLRYTGGQEAETRIHDIIEDSDRLIHQLLATRGEDDGKWHC